MRPRWEDEESKAVVETVNRLMEEHVDVNKGEIFSMARELINEEFGRMRSDHAIRNHYYSLKRDEVEINTTDDSHVSDIETREIIEYIDLVIDGYKNLTAENKRLKEEVATIKQDYETMLIVLERARKLVVDEQFPVKPKKFAMEANGNLVSIG